MSKYQPLADYLARLTQDHIHMSFAEVEKVLGFELPDSARKYPAWWANSKASHTHTWANLWMRNGWIKSGVNFEQAWVKFQRVEYFGIGSKKAIEGYQIDQKILSRKRNRALAKERKRLDDYSCQACGFRLKINESFIIEAHHINPLADTGAREITLDDLVSLCPNCHRIAHLRSKPYELSEIKEILSNGC